MDSCFFSSSTFRIVHGSLDSADLDVVYLSCSDSHRLPSGAELVSFQREHPDEDVNFALFDRETGTVCACCRGLPSEVNNALLSNERLEGRQLASSVLRKSPRCMGEKVLDTLQRFAISVRRTDVYRNEAIDALRSNSAASFLRLFQNVDWDANVAAGPDEAKHVAFMVGQTIALLNGEEVYTKAAIAKCVPCSEAALLRKPGAAVNGVLQKLRKLLSDFAVFQHGSVALCKLESEVCLCSFEKNLCRLIGLVPKRTTHFRFGGLVVAVSPVNWKAKVKTLPKPQRLFECFDENDELI
jgi:hypothetical protein